MAERPSTVMRPTASLRPVTVTAPSACTRRSPALEEAAILRSPKLRISIGPDRAVSVPSSTMPRLASCDSTEIVPARIVPPALDAMAGR